AEESHPLCSRVPLMSEEFEASNLSGTRTISSHSLASLDSIALLSPDHPLTQALPTPIPTRISFHRRTTYTETEDESSNSDAEGQGSEDEGLSLDDEGHGLEDEGLGSEEEEEEEEAAPEGQQQAVLVVNTTVDEPLCLGYGALRCHVLEFGEGSVPSTFELGHSSGSRGWQSLHRHSDLPPVAPVQTPPSPEWSSGSFPVSPSSLVVPLPIASAVTTPATTISVDEDQFLKVGTQLELHGSILHDHTQRLDALPSNLFEGYDKDLRELYTRAIWRPILALEAWTGQTDAQREALWHAIYDIQRENHDLRRRISKERHERLELTDCVARMKRWQKYGGE
nr:hypothetical protein [Tanacetum cinerariifolium]